MLPRNPRAEITERERKEFPTPLPLNYCDFPRFTTLSDGFPFLIFAFHSPKDPSVPASLPTQQRVDGDKESAYEEEDGIGKGSGGV